MIFFPQKNQSLYFNNILFNSARGAIGGAEPPKSKTRGFEPLHYGGI